MKLEPIEPSNRDMEFVKLRDVSREQIITACKIPVSVKGTSKYEPKEMYYLWFRKTFGRRCLSDEVE